MSPPSEDKLLSFLAEIQSDIRQIKSDLQALITISETATEGDACGFIAIGEMAAQPRWGGGGDG
jgi:hypothetical protein